MFYNIILNPKVFFFFCIKLLRPRLICDVGCLDGAESLYFKKILSKSKIIAFEANPHYANKLSNNKAIKENKIQIEHYVVWNHNKGVLFNIEKKKPNKKSEKWRFGISSTRKRIKNSLGTEEIHIPSTRLDTFIQNLSNIPKSIALWIDVEGAAFEVLEGIEDIKHLVKIIHVEVETQQVWRGQKLRFDVEALMLQKNFILMAQGLSIIQPDLVFVNVRTFTQHRAIFIVIIFITFMITFILEGLKKIKGIFKKKEI